MTKAEQNKNNKNICRKRTGKLRCAAVEVILHEKRKNGSNQNMKINIINGKNVQNKNSDRKKERKKM